MNDVVTVLDLIKQMSVSVPSIIAGTMVLTGMINGAFNIQNNNVKGFINTIKSAPIMRIIVILFCKFLIKSPLRTYLYLYVIRYVPTWH